METVLFYTDVNATEEIDSYVPTNSLFAERFVTFESKPMSAQNT